MSGPDWVRWLPAEATAAIDRWWKPLWDHVLVVGSSSIGPLARVFLGSRSAKIVQHAPVPVVVVPRSG